MTTHRACCCDETLDADYGLLVIRTLPVEEPVGWLPGAFCGTQSLPLSNVQIAETAAMNYFYIKSSGITFDESSIYRRKISDTITENWAALDEVTFGWSLNFLGTVAEDNNTGYEPYFTDSGVLDGKSNGDKDVIVREYRTLILPKQLKNKAVIPEPKYSMFYLDQFRRFARGPETISKQVPGVTPIPIQPIAFPGRIMHGSTQVQYTPKEIVAEIYTTLFNHCRDISSPRSMESKKYWGTNYLFNNGWHTSTSKNWTTYTWNIMPGANSGIKFISKQIIYPTWDGTLHLAGGTDPADCCGNSSGYGSCSWCGEEDEIVVKSSVNPEEEEKKYWNIVYSDGMAKLDKLIKQEINREFKTPNSPKIFDVTKPLYLLKSIDSAYTIRAVTNGNGFYTIDYITPNDMYAAICGTDKVTNAIEAFSSGCGTGSPCCGTLNTQTFFTFNCLRYDVKYYLQKAIGAIPIEKVYLVKYCITTGYNPETETQQKVVLLQDEYVVPVSNVYPSTSDLGSRYDSSDVWLGPTRDLFYRKTTPEVRITIDGCQRLGDQTRTEGSGPCCNPEQIKPIGCLCKRTTTWINNSDCCSACADCCGALGCPEPRNVDQCNGTEVVSYIFDALANPDTGECNCGSPGNPNIQLDTFCCASDRTSTCGDSECYTCMTQESPCPESAKKPAPCCSRSSTQTDTITKVADIYPGLFAVGNPQIRWGCESPMPGPCARNGDGAWCIQNGESPGGTPITEWNPDLIWVDVPPTSGPDSCDCEPCAASSWTNPNLQQQVDALTRGRQEFILPNRGINPKWLLSKGIYTNGIAKGISFNNGIPSDKNFNNTLVKKYILDEILGANFNQLTITKSNFYMYADFSTTSGGNLLYGVTWSGNHVTRGQITGERWNITPYRNPIISLMDTYQGEKLGPLGKYINFQQNNPWSALKRYAKDVYRCSLGGIENCQAFAGITIDIGDYPLGFDNTIFGTTNANEYQAICQTLVDWFGVTHPANKPEEKEVAIDIFPVFPLHGISYDTVYDWCFPKYYFDHPTFDSIFWKYSSKNPNTL